MPEKMSYTLVSNHLLEWSVFSPEIKAELCSHALLSDGKVVPVDPAMPDAATLTAIKKLGNTAAILPTSGNHERASRELAKFPQVPVASSALAARDFGFKSDIIIDDLKQIYGITPVPLPGGASGKHGYYCANSRTLILGDAILNLPPDGLVVLPEKYCGNAAQLKVLLAA
jgi:hypothetical protein